MRDIYSIGWIKNIKRMITRDEICIVNQIRQLADDKIIDQKDEWRKYHPVGVSVPHRNICYNHNIPLGLRTTIRQNRIKDENHEMTDAKIIENEICMQDQPRRGDKIVDKRMTYNPKPRRGATIIADEIFVPNQIRHLVDQAIIDETYARKSKCHPAGVSFPNDNLCYNPTIRQNRIKTQIQKLADTNVNDIKTKNNI